MKYIDYLSFIFILGLASGVVGCADVSVEKTRTFNPDVQPLLKQLHMQYGSMALRKQNEGNPDSVHHFNAKALQAAEGLVVKADQPADDESRDAYRRLTAGLTEAAMPVDPAVKARAQVMFDCWLDERAQGVDKDDIKACKQEFERALLSIESASSGVAFQ
ncbi:hypothetical protein L2D14_06760 [Thalassospiraceae bacterium LMO-JJ14]|nr:hypothetical protein L2D14_06760 [Thalassospiraceae bacterium LMO-JJ14]